MKSHEPKAGIASREFLKEVGIVVLGVLLALGAEQVVEAIRWSNDVAQARAALSIEFAGDIALSEERARMAPCLARRMQEVARILDRASETSRLPPVGTLGGPPERTWTDPSWASALASQTAGHLPRKDLLSYSSFAAYAAQLDGQNNDEMMQWARLDAIVGPGRAIGMDEIGRLRTDLSQAHYLAKIMTFNSAQLARWIRQNGIASKGVWPDDPEDPARVPTACRPLGPAPSTYGNAPPRYELPGWAP